MRNIIKYQNPLGPTAKWLRVRKGRLDFEIITSASKPDGGNIIPFFRDFITYYMSP
jgi:hypothetical protein